MLILKSCLEVRKCCWRATLASFFVPPAEEVTRLSSTSHSEGLCLRLLPMAPSIAWPFEANCFVFLWFSHSDSARGS